MIAPENLAAITEGARIAQMLPYLAEEVAKMERAVENRVFEAIRTGELTGQMAVSAWMEKRSLRGLLAKMEQKVRLGQSVGQRHQELLSPAVPAPKYHEDLPLPG